MNIVFDTSALSLFIDGDKMIVSSVLSQPTPNFYIPFCAEGELQGGYAYGMKCDYNRTRYQKVSARYGMEVLYPDDETIQIYTEISVYLKRHGIALSHNDIWIAALSMQKGALLATTDNDFKNVPQIRLMQLQ